LLCLTSILSHYEHAEVGAPETFEERRGGPLLSFDDVVKDLKRRGRI